MSLGLSHSLSRYKLKFSPDKVSPDTAPECLLWYSLCAARHGISCFAFDPAYSSAG